MDGQVFGRVAGESAAAYARGHAPAPAAPASAADAVSGLSGTGSPAPAVRQRVQALMTGAAGVIRTEERLRQAWPR